MNDQLRRAVAALRVPVFAVVDGAQFEDLPRALLDSEVGHRPLYTDRGDGDRQRVLTAPQFIPLSDEDAGGMEDDPAEALGASPGNAAPADPGEAASLRLDRLLQVLDGRRSAAVFWACGAGGGALFRHLRTINMALVPKSSFASGGEMPGETPAEAAEPVPVMAGSPAADDSHERVLFRHADANVLAQIAPALDPHQLARLVGPAEAVFFSPDDDWEEFPPGGAGPSGEPRSPLKILRHSPDWPPPPAGPLRLEPSNMERIEQRRLLHAENRIADYLRETAADHLQGLEGDSLRRVVTASVREARSLGIRTEAGLGRWSYLYLVTGGKLSKQDGIADYIRGNDGKSPDHKAALLMKSIALAAEKNGV